MKKILHKSFIKISKYFFHLLRRAHKLFTGAGVVVITAVLVIGVFMLIWWNAGAVRSTIESHLEKTLIERLLLLVSNEPNQPNPFKEPALREIYKAHQPETSNLVSASFSDLFSGIGWLNMNATTMYHDRVATAFTFEPAFELRPADKISRIEDEEWCINTRCLTLNNNILSSNDVPITLPKNEGTLVSVSVGVLDTKWVVGLVYEHDGTYIGTLYYFNGSIFTPISLTNQENVSEKEFISKYSGSFGFGGGDDNWIAIYGGYEGIAFQFRKSIAPKNISSFVGMRLMDGGFVPRVLRVNSLHTWYVWDTAGVKYRFLKFFEDNEGNIIGVVNLAERFIEKTGGEVRHMEIIPVASNQLSIRFTFADSVVRDYSFIDGGFFVPDSHTKIIQSSDLNLGRNATVRQARIYRADINGSSLLGPTELTLPVNFFLTNKPEEWIPAKIGESISFPDESGENLFWKAEFSFPSNSNLVNQLGAKQTLFSPFFDFIQVEYFLNFQQK